MNRRQALHRQKTTGIVIFGLIILLLILILLLIAVISAKKPNQDPLPGVATMSAAEQGPLPNDTVSPPSTEAPPDEPTWSIEEIKQLSSESSGWAFGNSLDADNRPKSALKAQEKWGEYDADFIRNGEDKTIYLTFDCGYENGYTGKILDALKTHQVKAVFFVTGYYVRTQPELVNRMIDEGHIVGNHSMNHPSGGLPSVSVEKQLEELRELHDYVLTHYDYEMWLFRFPAGEFSEQSLAVVQSLGYRSVFWSYAHADWDPDNQPDEAKSLERLVNRLHSGAIYLLHAVSATNTAILPDLITQARDLGYTFAEQY